MEGIIRDPCSGTWVIAPLTCHHKEARLPETACDMMPQPVCWRLSPLLIARAGLKIRLLFYSKIPLAWFPADVCTGFGAEPDPRSDAGLIRWDEAHLQVKISVRLPPSEAWSDPGDQSLQSRHDCLPCCSSAPATLEANCWSSGRCSIAKRYLRANRLAEGRCQALQWFSYVLRNVGGGERAVWSYLKQSGLKMDSIVLLLSVLISIWICSYRTLSKKCQISLA